MVELLPLNNTEDIAYVKQLLEEFVKKTGSLIAKDLLNLWPEPTTRFVKVLFFSPSSFLFSSLLSLSNYRIFSLGINLI